MKNNLSARMLEAFVELADCRHFSQAAARSSLSPSAFSKLIQRLEAAAGVRLFNRSTRSVSLTTEGELFARRARELLRELEASLGELRDQAECRRGRVAVAALPSLAAQVVPPVYAAYAGRHPGIALHLHDRLADGCLELLRQGAVDFALTAPATRLAEFEVREIAKERFYLVCPDGHRLARRRSVRLGDLADTMLIHLARSSSVRQQVSASVPAGAVLESTLEVEHLATLAGLVASGLGVTIVPELTLFYFRRDGLSIVPIDAPALRRPLLVVRRKGMALSRPASEMQALLERAVATHLRKPRGLTAA